MRSHQPSSQVRRNAFTYIKGLSLQGACGEQIQTIAIGLGLHELEHTASPARYLRYLRIRPTHQCRRHRRLPLIQPIRRLAKQRSAQCINAYNFTAKRHQIQIRFQNLVLAPVCFQHLGKHGLANFLPHAATTATGT